MELRIEDIKSTVLRLQGQMDVWQTLYREAEAAAKKAEETKHVDIQEA